MLNEVLVVNNWPEEFPLQAVKTSFFKKSDVAAAHESTHGREMVTSVEYPTTANKISCCHSFCERL